MNWSVGMLKINYVNSVNWVVGFGIGRVIFCSEGCQVSPSALEKIVKVFVLGLLVIFVNVGLLFNGWDCIMVCCVMGWCLDFRLKAVWLVGILKWPWLFLLWKVVCWF